MPIKDNREYRSFVSFDIEPVQEDGTDNKYIVRGYASTFEPYTLFENDGRKYNERVDRQAFDNADLSDVIFQYNHQGPVYARNKNNSLRLFVDDHGLGVEANLGLTSRSRQLYEDIEAGLIDQMSFGFTVAKAHIEKDTRTRVIDAFKKIYDVSAVSIPANPSTEIGISTRSLFDGLIEEEQQEMLEMERREKARKALQLRIKIGGYLKDHGN